MIRRKRKALGLNSVGISIKMPESLKRRIDILAQKSCLTRNAWIVNNLIRDARWELPLPKFRKARSVNSSNPSEGIN